MTRIGVAQRRARLGVRHHLATAAPDPVQATRAVVALHSTDPASVFLSIHARTPPVAVTAIEEALYQQRSLLRMHGMRRTMFVVPTELAPVVQAACTRALVAPQRRRYAKLIAGGGGVGDAEWLAATEDETALALAALGEATGAQLSAAVPRLRTQLSLNEGKAYAAKVNITTWVLFLLAADGRIVRGRPRGAWTSSQYTWSPATAWLPGGLGDLPAERGRVELVRAWLAAYGPGTVADVKWWTGLTAGQVRQALTAIGPDEVDLDGRPGLALPGDVAPVPAPPPWVALLPALDPTAMGWTDRSWFLGAHAPALFDRSGNIGPTVWSDGRIVGGWAQRRDGEVVVRLLEDIGREAVAAVDAAAAGLAGWIGPVRVTPRFRTPLERDLTA